MVFIKLFSSQTASKKSAPCCDRTLTIRRASLTRGVLPFLRLYATLVFLGASPAALAIDAPPPQGNLERLQIVTASGTHEFSVEVMRSEPQRERGLMFRRFLPQDRGMLFDFGTERPVMMWMKNTYLPLDMIFISRAGKVSGLAENTEPLSEKIIPSGAPAYGVLEVNAGTAARIGLRIGDDVRHPLFAK
ncbi:MAG TPA: DUF192 domain-containing protein [Methylocella sp.]|jgi:hypothetical protein